MAPELFTGGTADQRSDIYSLGALLFYLVTAQYPVSGRSLDEVRQAHARGERMRLRDLRADVPAAFVRVVEQSLAVDPEPRFQTSGAMEAALETIEPAVGRALPAQGVAPLDRRGCHCGRGNGRGDHRLVHLS